MRSHFELEDWLTLMLMAMLPLLATAGFAGEPPTNPTQVFWGDTHVHTHLSQDAFVMGTRLTPEDAYRFAKGESVRATGGREVQLRRPLDFLMVADHAENLGVLPMLAAGDDSIPKSEATHGRGAVRMANPPQPTRPVTTDL